MAAHFERRKSYRVRFPETFRVKARIKKLGEKRTNYFDIVDLGMGGLSMTCEHELSDFQEGDDLEVLIFRKNLSLRLTAKIVEGGMTLPVKDPLKNEDVSLSPIRAKIIGIDDASRKMLAVFLEELIKEFNQRVISP